MAHMTKLLSLQMKGFFRIIDEKGNTLLEHKVQKGDIYRANQAKYDAVINWTRYLRVYKELKLVEMKRFFG